MVDEDAEVHPEESGQECQRQEKCGPTVKTLMS